MKERLAKSRLLATIWLPTLLIVPAIFGILLPLVLGHYQEQGWSITLFEVGLNSVFAAVFFFLATVTMLMSLDTMFPFLGLAGIISQLGNWGGISAYMLNKGTFTFGEYEFLWLCGIITFWYGFVVVARQMGSSGAAYLSPQSSMPEAHAAQGRSLVVQQRMTVMGGISASLIVAVLLSSRDIWSYRIVFFGISLGSYVAMLVGELLSKQIIHYATQFGRVVNLTATAEPGKAGRDIPVELWQVYRMGFHEEAVQHRMDVAVRKNLSELASQVAHDIRSPLVALDSIVGEASHIQEDKRLVVRSAVGRIRDIANTLLEKHREAPAGEAPEAAPDATSPSLLSSLIDPLITEKRVKFRPRIGVEIDAPWDAASYGLFARVEPVEFKRAVSNLIDNAVEAIPEGRTGTVLVSVAAQADAILVRVKDDGRGIPADLLPRLGAKGESHGKPNGSGLGLYHAKTCAEAWGGRLEIVSKEGRGTTVAISLPQALPPAWFVSELVIDPGETVVILDDDSSIHQVWARRLGSLWVGAHRVQVRHFSTPAEIRAWVRQDTGRAGAALYLIDQELLGFSETGLSLAAELGIGERSVLVTSRYEEAGILDGCRKMGARMIPKGLAGLVPIRVTSGTRERWDAVLIDDDPIVRQIWTFAAESAGKRFLTFSSPAEFLREAERIGRASPIYIDEQLGEGVKGHEVSIRIHARGFSDITLATGREVAPAADLRYIKAVVGKEPPWRTEAVAG
ncbi:HAMP domain-containing histidine kinase [bacterium]|nr:MAG: HAMP domain-containing histidine kinase [bacterium]